MKNSSEEVQKTGALGKRISIVIPVYRSEKILPTLIEKILEAMTNIYMQDKFELILVNDCSPDNSWTEIVSLANSHAFIKGVSLRKNFGQHNAVMAGLHHAVGDYVITMDDDLQHPPHAIQQLIEKLAEGYDVCYTKYLGRQHAAWKKLGSRFNDFVATKILQKQKGLYLSSFKGMTIGVVKEIIRYDGPYAYVDGLILDVTKSITSVDIQHQKREEGEGNYNLRRSISLWLKMATSFSILPLRLATLAGFALSALSVLMIVYLTIDKYLHPEYPLGWASIVAAIFFVGGIQTLCLGMIGEYLGRTYLKLNKKPQFIIKETTFKSVDGN